MRCIGLLFVLVTELTLPVEIFLCRVLMGDAAPVRAVFVLRTLSVLVPLVVLDRGAPPGPALLGPPTGVRPPELAVRKLLLALSVVAVLTPDIGLLAEDVESEDKLARDAGRELVCTEERVERVDVVFVDMVVLECIVLVLRILVLEVGLPAPLVETDRFDELPPDVLRTDGDTLLATLLTEAALDLTAFGPDPEA